LIIYLQIRCNIRDNNAGVRVLVLFFRALGLSAILQGILAFSRQWTVAGYLYSLLPIKKTGISFFTGETLLLPWLPAS
jgi:hypothetical protein